MEWVLHQDNAQAHKALSVKTFLTKHKITVLEHPPYSPDLAPCDFFVFPKINSALKGTSPYMQLRQKRRSSWISFQKTICSIAYNSGRFAWSGVGIGEGEYIEGDNIYIV